MDTLGQHTLITDLITSQDTSIADALATVHSLRALQAAQPLLQTAVRAVKRAQCDRFQRTYGDVLVHPDWSRAARFFLDELYSDRDYSQRDAEFERIAPRIERFFPHSVSAIALSLAQLHALSEQLDHAMGKYLMPKYDTKLIASSAISVSALDTIAREYYVEAWRAVGHESSRDLQLSMVQKLGRELASITRVPGLRVMLRMMRGPASAAGLQHLQQFLEAGFDTFAAMQRSRSGVDAFLAIIKQREHVWINRLFDLSSDNTEIRQAWAALE